MPNRDRIVIGGSAGAIEVLRLVLASLPAELPAAILLVIHVNPTARSMLPAILARATKLTVEHAVHGEPIRNGHVYVAPPDQHLLVYGDHLRLTKGPRENGHRPAIDPLFRTAAKWYGPRVMGVALSGVLDDGCAGMLAVKLAQGLVITQDPDEATYSGIPRAVIDHVGADYILRSEHLAELLVARSGEAVPEVGRRDRPNDVEPEETPMEDDPETDATKGEGRPASGFTCPDCNGALWELSDGALVRFRCRVGHAYSAEALVDAQQNAVEDAMWSAYRALEESAEMYRRLHRRALGNGHTEAARRYQERLDGALQHAHTIRRTLGNGDPSDPPPPPSTP